MTMANMDGHLDLPKHYELQPDGAIVGLKGQTEPLSASDLKACPMCRSPIRRINRYNRIVKRGVIDEATKKFITWSNAQFVPLAERFNALEQNLASNAKAIPSGWDSSQNASDLSTGIDLTGESKRMISNIWKVKESQSRYKDASRFRRELTTYLRKVTEEEQPFGRIRDLIQDKNRRLNLSSTTDTSNDSILQTRGRLLASSLLMRCDLLVLGDFLRFRREHSLKSHLRDWTDRELLLNTSLCRRECQRLMEEARQVGQRMIEAESLIYIARFAGLERSNIDPDKAASQSSELQQEGREKLAAARLLCQTYPGQTRGLKPEIEAAETTLRDSTFYSAVTSEEKKAVYAAMSLEFRGTGHWYYCRNMHP